jgi:SAM-dependent methyltransferase
MRSFLDFLRDPSMDALNADDASRIALHKAMFDRKRMLREVFVEFHHLFDRLDRRYFSGRGTRLELGAGVAPMRDSYPSVIATDIVFAPHLDRELNAEAMELESESVHAVFGQNCFHHFPHPDRFFDELERVLVPGGGAVLLEPYYGPFATFLFKRLFKTEGFDKSYPSWETPITGPMNGANQALSYLVFTRDRAVFERKHPRLKIVHQAPVGNYLKYLLSGGLNFKQLLPDWFAGPIGVLERIISPLNRWIALHHVIVIRKEPA